MDNTTREYRMKVADRIKRERKRTGMLQKDFAKEVGLSNQTYNNLENGLGSLRVEHLHKIAEYCGCDMGYLLCDYDNRTREVTDICEATGLSEEAVNVLIGIEESKSKNLKDLSDLFPEEEIDRYSNTTDVRNIQKKLEIHSIFTELLENIIIGYRKDKYFNLLYADLLEPDERDSNVFPIIQMVAYIREVRKNNKFKKHELYDTLMRINREGIKENKGIGYTYTKKKLLEMGYDEEFISNNTSLITDSIIHDRFERWDKRYRRIDIQDSFSDFLKSDFVEGENDGK